jgi:uncharacterized protein (DUF2141 family)
MTTSPFRPDDTALPPIDRQSSALQAGRRAPAHGGDQRMRPSALLALLAGAAVSWTAAPASAEATTPTVTGLAGPAGEVGCALQAEPSSFPTGEGRSVRVAPTDGVAVCRFEDVAPGVCAVASSHDMNGNRVTDTNPLGMPTERWGVSNDVRPFLRAPTYDDARFTVPASGVTLTIAPDD